MMPRPSPPAVRTRCRLCGATSYRRVVGRDDAGAIRPTGMYQCSGCSLTFLDPKAWRGTPAAALAPEATHAAG